MTLANAQRERHGDHFHHHDDDHEHYVVDDSIAEFIYSLDNVEFTTIGVDVGSSTYHLMFSRVHLQREDQKMSSRFRIVEREVLWRSRIRLTPYAGRFIDADAVSSFVRQAHEAAGLAPEDVATGAVILTGEALRQRNASSLAQGIAAGSGKFVCVSAGHHLEALLAAQGSGAVQHSEAERTALLHIDVGGGTTKFALIDSGKVLATAAILVGGRQLSWNDNREILSIYAGSRPIARDAGLALAVGTRMTPESEHSFVAKQVDAVLGVLERQRTDLGRRLRLTEALPLSAPPQAVSFSGGVAEYIYGREEGSYSDLGAALGKALRERVERAGFRIVDPGEGIRATVIGASQFSVQLSGKTVTVSDPSVLPVHNVPVVHPACSHSGDDKPSAGDVAASIERALKQHGRSIEMPLALAFSWSGTPSYERLQGLAQGIQLALARKCDVPAILLLEEDIGASLGRLLLEEFPIQRPLICLDGLTLSPFDHVDVGRVIEPTGVLPVVIKSLLFGEKP